MFVAERPELEATPDRFTARMENQRRSPRRLAGQRLGGWMKARGQIGQIARACRTVSLTSESHHRLSRITGQLLPGPVHPDQLERRVEPEDRLARQLPELIRLERDEA